MAKQRTKQISSGSDHMETIFLAEDSTDRLRITQRTIKQAILSIYLRDKDGNKEIRRKTRIVDIIECIANLKWKWIRHIARQSHERWTAKIQTWRPHQTKRITGATNQCI